MSVMSSRRSNLIALACAATALPSALSLAPGTALAYTEHSVGTPEQIAWVRRAAGTFINAELAGDGAGACGILNAPLRYTRHHQTCAQRWDARLAAMLRSRSERARLHALRRAAPSARVVVHGDRASIELPSSLMGNRVGAAGGNDFLWTENCWMLTS
jgi:hypothetical protein